MISLNRVIIAGKVGNKPDLHETANGRKFSDFNIIITDCWKDRNGETMKKSTFVNVSCCGSLADNVVKYLTKGKSAMVEGRIETDTYTDDNGKKHYITKINANNIVFLESDRNKSKGEENVF